MIEHPDPQDPDSAPVPMRWSDLAPDPSIREALAYAGLRPEEGDQNAKRRWSEKFAHACAVAFARELRDCADLRGKAITPAAIGEGTEALVPLGAGARDPSLSGQAARCDSAYVALYATGEGALAYPAGIVRLINVKTAPPRRGRPRIADTLSIREAVDEIVAQATFSAEAEWGQAEVDPHRPDPSEG